jgi:hypothetical protein
VIEVLKKKTVDIHVRCSKNFGKSCGVDHLEDVDLGGRTNSKLVLGNM